MSTESWLDSSVLKQHFLAEQGVFKEYLSWSTNNGSTEYETGILQITPRGVLVATDTGKVLINGLQSCVIRSMGNKLLVGSWNSTQKVSLCCDEPNKYAKLLSCLVFWQGLSPQGVVNKRIILPYTDITNSRSDSLLVCSCKVYGQIPRSKSVDLVEGPKVSLYPQPDESWFTAMVVLKGNGLMELLSESDGSLLYTIDIKLLLRSEIREIHNSIFESSNYLYIGIIDELRKQRMSNSRIDEAIPRISKEAPKLSRVLLQFPYRIDVEDWLIALLSFSIREYIGINVQNSLRVSRKLTLGILEAKLDHLSTDRNAKLYAEVYIWNAPWYRTALVESTQTPFFRELFDIDLPISAKSFQIVLKAATGLHFSKHDHVIGHCKISYEQFSNKKYELETRVPLLAHKKSMGSLCVTIQIEKNYILSPDNFNNFEQMILNSDNQKLLGFVLEKGTNAMNLQRISIIFLDLFQALQQENEWFDTLIEEEVGKLSSSISTAPNLYNSLFRGNSLLTKSLEIYDLRVGHEYLEKVAGTFITKIISNYESMEIDPARINEKDEESKKRLLESNSLRLLKHCEEIWSRIYKTSNDLPAPIKRQLTVLRKKLEIVTDDSTVTLNCISGFLFLRFFCPVLLNPKLFFLTTDHQTGDVKRSLILISKILLTLANRLEFGAREPYLSNFNSKFIEKHKAEMVEYLDKVTGKRMDFTEKRLKLSSSLDRPQILLSSRSIMKELPSNLFLIDKYLRMDQLVDLLKSSDHNIDNAQIDDYGDSQIQKTPLLVTSNEDLLTIGSLEFEKLEPSELEKISTNDYEFGSEQFIQNLLKTKDSEKVFNYINSGSSLKDLIVEADRLYAKKYRLLSKLSAFETAEGIPNLKKFTNYLLGHTVLDSDGRILKARSSDKHLRSFIDDSTFTILKSKFSQGKNPDSNDNSSLDYSDKAHLSNNSSSRRLSKMIRSASINSLSSFVPLNTPSKVTVNEASIPETRRGLKKWLAKR